MLGRERMNCLCRYSTSWPTDAEGRMQVKVLRRNVLGREGRESTVSAGTLLRARHCSLAERKKAPHRPISVRGGGGRAAAGADAGQAAQRCDAGDRWH